MDLPLFERLVARAYSSRFQAFLRGTKVTVSPGAELQLRIAEIERSIRPAGLRLSKHAFVCKVYAGDFEGYGYGESEYELIAIQKAIAEGVERAIFMALQGSEHKSATSSGWAAHVSPARAHRAALDEILERDAVLVHWLTRRPMTSVGIGGGPNWLKQWAAEELPLSRDFRRLKVLVSSAGHLPTATVALMTSDGRAVMSHASAATLEHGVYKALIEACRLGQVAGEGVFIESSSQLRGPLDPAKTYPEDHALFYAHHEAFPPWIGGESRSWEDAARGWRARYRCFRPEALSHSFHQVADGPLVVGYCTSDRVQKLFFGRTEAALRRGLIDVRRLKEVRQDGEINLMPHCIS